MKPGALLRAAHQFRAPTALVLALSLVLLGVAAGDQAAPAKEYYVSLPKLGLVSGRRLELVAGAGPRWAAFLSVPYAAPPTGPLRFMPAGAPSQAPAAARHWRTLADTGRRERLRPHGRPGNACVHLPDWLPSATGSAARGQAEECLSASVYVPLDGARDGADEPAGVDSPSSEQARRSNSSRELGANVKPASAAADKQDEAGGAPLVWPLAELRRPGSLPVLVLVQEEAHRGPEPAAYLSHLAERAILVTFGYRTGLLGFLPLTEELTGGAARTNHAIYDHLALLHWIRKNLGRFGGQTADVTLLAADHKAAQLLQLLALCPLAKGLFRRLVLLQDERRPEAAEQVGGLRSFSDPARAWNAAELREARRQLASALSRVLDSQPASQDEKSLERSGSSAAEPPAVLEFLQSANLSQLAQLQLQLAGHLTPKQLALALGPAPDDRLLFPHLSAPASKLQERRSAATATPTVIKYQAYLRQLYAEPSDDPLGLLVSRHPPSQHVPAVAPVNSTGARTTKPASPDELELIAETFEHLRCAQLIHRLLASQDEAGAQSSPANSEVLDAARTSSTYTGPCPLLKQQQQQQQQQPSNLSQVSELDGQLLSFELLLASAPLEPSDDYQRSHKGTIQQAGSNFGQLLNALTSGRYAVQQHLLNLLELADAHSLAHLAAAIGQCDARSKTFVYVAPRSDSASLNHSQAPIMESSGLFQPVRRFVEFGQTGWPSYNPVSRRMGGGKNQELSSELSLHLDLVPYLSADQEHWQPNFSDLYSCMVELNSSLKPGVRATGEQLECLGSEVGKLRRSLRQLASEHLEPAQRLKDSADSKAAGSRNLVSNDKLLMERQAPGGSIAAEPDTVSAAHGRLASSKLASGRDLIGSLLSFVRERTLAVVLVSGFLVFLANLIIVLVIALRTNRARASQVADSSQDGSDSRQAAAAAKHGAPDLSSSSGGSSSCPQLTSSLRNSSGRVAPTPAGHKRLTFCIPGELESTTGNWHEELGSAGSSTRERAPAPSACRAPPGVFPEEEDEQRFWATSGLGQLARLAASNPRFAGSSTDACHQSQVAGALQISIFRSPDSSLSTGSPVHFEPFAASTPSPFQHLPHDVHCPCEASADCLPVARQAAVRLPRPLSVELAQRALAAGSEERLMFVGHHVPSH